MKLQNLFIAAAVLFSTTAINAQVDTHEDSHNVTIGIPNVALLDIESTGGSNNSITLSAIAPAEAGNKLNFEADGSSNSDLWINYSSIVSGTVKRQVTVAITNPEDLPGGLELKVIAAPATAAGDGEKGAPTAVVILSGANQPVITAIGSAYTGDGTKGHNLTYQLAQKLGSYSDLRSDDSSEITIIYTLSEID